MFFFNLKPRKLGMLRYHNTILLQYEVHDTIFTGIFKKTNEVQMNIFYIVKLFYLMHFVSSKLRAPTHVLN